MRDSGAMQMNHKMNYLKAIGIIMVVLGHLGCEPWHWFPIYSFHMPLFFFVAGYFYKEKYEQEPLLFLKKKVKSLLLPYYKWNLIYGLLVTLLLWAGFTYDGARPLGLRSFFLDPWLYGGQFVFNTPGWFVIALFLTAVSALLLRKLLSCFIRSEWVMLLIFSLLCYAGECLAVSRGFVIHKSMPMDFFLGSWEDFFVWHFARTAFGLFFYEVGLLYRKKLEAHDRLDFRWWCPLLLLQTFLIYLQQGDITFSMVTVQFPAQNLLIPMVTSLTGIYLCLKLSELLAACQQGGSDILSLVGRGSWTVMINHVFGIWLLNLCFYLLQKSSLLALSGFETARFKAEALYLYTPLGDFSLCLYFFAGLGFSCLLHFWLEKHGIDR